MKNTDFSAMAIVVYCLRKIKENKMAAPVAAARAIPVVVRAISKPKVFKRFLGTKAGKKAVLKWGKMLVNSKIAQSSIDKLMSRMGNSGKSSTKYKKMTKEYVALQKKVAALEEQLETVKNDNVALETKTFTLGRQVVQMQQLYKQMLTELQNQQQMMMVQEHVR